MGIEMAMNNISLTEINEALENDYFSARPMCPNSEILDKLSTEYVLNWFDARSEKSPDSDQAAAIGSMNKSVEIVARAGSGKTTAARAPLSSFYAISGAPLKLRRVRARRSHVS